eukprot:XP_016663255.1 PREDICTED: uncharacterized protein LOC107884835 isoform X2 [Acyrthosiphon pisum]
MHGHCKPILAKYAPCITRRLNCACRNNLYTECHRNYIFINILTPSSRWLLDVIHPSNLNKKINLPLLALVIIEMLDSNKNVSDSQTIQFIELKFNLKQVSSLITELKDENSKLGNILEMLKGKIITMACSTSSNQSYEVVSLVLHETFERDRCWTNMIA